MKKLFLFNTLFIIYTFSFAQKNSSLKNNLPTQKEVVVNHKYDMIICKVEIDTCYPGGETAWKNYLSKNFRKNEVLCQMISRDTVYTETALIIFIIDKDGSITDVKCANKDSINIALQKEAIRLISEAPKWIPGQQNGRNVRAYRKEKISITVLPRYV